MKTEEFLTRSKRYKTYKKLVWKLTEVNKKHIQGIEERDFKGMHIDHIVSVWACFRLGIVPCWAASIENLRMLPAHENIKKRASLTADAVSLLEKWSIDSNTHTFYNRETHKRPIEIRRERMKQMSTLTIWQ